MSSHQTTHSWVSCLHTPHTHTLTPASILTYFTHPCLTYTHPSPYPHTLITVAGSGCVLIRYSPHPVIRALHSCTHSLVLDIVSIWEVEDQMSLNQLHDSDLAGRKIAGDQITYTLMLRSSDVKMGHNFRSFGKLAEIILGSFYSNCSQISCFPPIKMTRE